MCLLNIKSSLILLLCYLYELSSLRGLKIQICTIFNRFNAAHLAKEVMLVIQHWKV